MRDRPSVLSCGSHERASTRGAHRRNYHPVRCGQGANLADVQLFTSVPPRISRTNSAGEEIGESYQAACIASWIDAGFAPATINARSERLDPESRLRQIRVERDASEITGKPHPYFGDLLSVIAEQTGPFALVNADIVIPPSAGLAQRVKSLRPGQMIFTRRLDVAQVRSARKAVLQRVRLLRRTQRRRGHPREDLSRVWRAVVGSLPSAGDAFTRLQGHAA